tara:strand:- start:1739 stop:2119 length:381 start_codon:yes stop_codon:yes gene_type:complete
MLMVEKRDGNQDGAQMKISKQKLKQIILEEFEILENKDEDDVKLQTQAMSTATRQADARARIAAQGNQFSAQEKGIVDQLEQYISDLASTNNVDLMQHRALLQRVLKYLKDQIVGTQNPSNQGEKK